MGFLWYFHDVSMISLGFLWDYFGIYGVPWCFYDISMELLWASCGNSMGFLWDFFVVPVLFPCGISMIFLWDFSGISMGFP
jgi:hypothetical protein